MKDLEKEPELEEKNKKILIENESKLSKKIPLKPRKIKRPPAKLVKKKNYFVLNNITHIDYKNTKLLSHFINKQGQIISKTFSKLPSNIQRKVAKNIKRARQIGLMPYILVDQGSF